MSMLNISFNKQMYQPTEINVVIHLFTYQTEDYAEEYYPLSTAMVDSVFKGKKVALHEVTITEGNSTEKQNGTIGEDFYIQEVQPVYFQDGMYLAMKIFSLDHLMTIEKGCNAFVAKKLGADILKEETKKFKLPWEKVDIDPATNEDKRKSVPYSYDNMKILSYKRNSGELSEHIFPYLVQYNESFYDMLKRTTNRWGEFLFYEDGKLNVGYDATKEVQKLTGWFSMNHCRLSDASMNNEKGHSYDPGAAYDLNIIDSQLKKSPDILKNLPQSGFDNGADVWMMKKIAGFLNNTKSIPNYIGSTLEEEAWNQLTAYQNKNTVDSAFNEEYFSEMKIPEQYGQAEFEGKMCEAHNPFTELNTTFKKDKYINILDKEQFASQNAIRINYDTTYPNLKLGQIVEVYGKQYIVVKVECKVENQMKVQDDLWVVNTDEAANLKYLVTVTAQNALPELSSDKDKDGNYITKVIDFGFYPAMLASGHIRVSEPQLAKVYDANDPLNQNRVRVHFTWQGVDVDKLSEDELKKAGKNASPWLVYATSAASKSNGIFGKHYRGDAVIVNFANGNVENPYVVGGLAMKGNKVPGSLSERDIVLSSPGGHTLRMDDGTGAGLTAFLAGTVFPGYELLTTFVPVTSGVDVTQFLKFKEKITRNFEGGFQLTDKYGIYTISGSTDGRNVSVKSPWGDVAISALTGISISAPNGDISIKGKNVTIEAGNNLELKSGTNVNFKLAQRKETKAGNVGAFLADMSTAALKKFGENLNLIDMSFYRNMLESFVRPIEGALIVKSNRFLKLEAGKGRCDYPVSAYKDMDTVNKMREKQKDELREGIKLQASMVELVNKVNVVANEINNKYITRYNNCYDKLHGVLAGPGVAAQTGLETAIQAGKDLVNGNDTNAKYCNNYNDLKDALWADGEKILKENDLGFNEKYKLGTQDVDNPCISRYAAAHHIADPANNLNAIKKRVIAERKQNRTAILAAANELRRAIIAFKKINKPQNKLEILSFAGALESTPVEGYRDAMTKAFNDKDAFYFTTIADGKKALDEKYGVHALDEECKLLKRRASVLLLEALGFRDDWRQGVDGVVPDRPFERADILNDEKWRKYVNSIVSVPQLSAMELSLFSKAKDALLDKGKDMVDYDNWAAIINIFRGKGENASWGEAKQGGILFSYKGNTYSLTKDIQKIEGAPKENLTVADELENSTVINGFLTALREALNPGPAPVIAAANP